MENNIQCPYCKEEIKSDASICKHCGKKVEYKLKELEKERLKQEKYKNREKFFGGNFINHLDEHKWVYIILSGAIIFSYIASSGEQQIKLPENTGICTQDVKNVIASEYYKSPSTVEFKSCVWKKDESSGVTRILGEVDSQNGFGAIIRSSVLCEVGEKTQCKVIQK